MTHISAMEQEIATQQKQLYNAYIRIKELNEEVNYLKKQIPDESGQLEFDFNANV
jgi:hypothetical protein|tara:strand:+ start:545 stop:709 length:165 start_codon:yes stop_codon:yes gene_type:complete